MPASIAPVLDVRLGQPNPGQSRIVIDLAKTVPFSAHADGSRRHDFLYCSGGFGRSRSASSGQETCSAQTQAAANVPDMPLPAWLTGTQYWHSRALPLNLPRPRRRIHRRLMLQAIGSGPPKRNIREIRFR